MSFIDSYMTTFQDEEMPRSAEGLGSYVRRQRERLGVSQKELATKAGIHPQSIGKIESNQTATLKSKTRQGLALALAIPSEYLEAACKGQTVEQIGTLKFCPHCWVPGTVPEPIWLQPRSAYCFLCGSALRSECSGCGTPITSLKHRFCPYCGARYGGEGT